ncbi:MAG: hypothetical protein J2P15_20395 [Micromonosporaceae bacterium]|nr:hypothetical protein [Micromonosporaceae bacterium]
MKQRWWRAGILVLVLFAVNAVARLIVWQVAPHDTKKQTAIGLIAAGAVGAVMIAGGYLWARRVHMARVVGELAVAILVGCAFSIVLGPYAGGSAPFKEGGDFLYSEVWHYLALAAAGAAFGVLVAITLGQDQKGRAWRRFEEQQRVRHMGRRATERRSSGGRRPAAKS